MDLLFLRLDLTYDGSLSKTRAMNIAQLLIEGLKKRCSHPAVHFGRQTVTYDELNRRVDRLAHGLVR